jgi:hypothetical protein
MLEAPNPLVFEGLSSANGSVEFPKVRIQCNALVRGLLMEGAFQRQCERDVAHRLRNVGGP